MTTKLNPIQLHLLQMFEHFKDEQELIDLKQVLAEYYAHRVDEMSERIWDEKKLSDTDMDALLQAHLRSHS